MQTLLETRAVSPAAELVAPRTPLKVCHLSSTRTLSARVFYRQLPCLAENGYEVCLICPSGVTGTQNGITLRTFSSVSGAAGRLLCAFLALPAALREQASVYHIHTPQMIPVGMILKLLFRKRVVYDIFEDFPSMALTKQSLPVVLRRLLGQVLYLTESTACRIFDGIVTADCSVLRMYRRSARHEKMVFYNLPSLQMFQQNGEALQPEPYDIVYSGGLSERTGMYVLVKAVRLLVDSGLKPRVLLFGYADSPRSLAQLRSYVADLGLEDCFDIQGRVTPPEVPALLRQARIGVVPLQTIPKFVRNIPTKLFEYWACGLATVASDLPPIRLFLRDSSLGLVVKPDDPAAFAHALSWLITHPQQAGEMGRRAQQAVGERLNSAREGARLIRFYQRILAQ